MLRLTAIRRLDFTNFTYTAAQVEIWSILEPYLGIINACIPVVQPALRRLFRVRNPGANNSRPKNSHPSLVTIGGSGWSSQSDKRRFRRLHDVSYQLQSIDRSANDHTINEQTINDRTIDEARLERVDEERPTRNKDPSDEYTERSRGDAS